MAEWVVPVEEITGIPLAVAPNYDLPPADSFTDLANGHHAVYPGSREEHSTISGAAIRNGRLQWLNLYDHGSLHHYFDSYMAEEWEFPRTISQRFNMALMLAALYIPEQGIKFTWEGPQYVRLDEYDREWLRRSGEIRTASDYQIFKFLRQEMLDCDPNPLVPQETIIEFVTTKDGARRKKLGNEILKATAEITTDAVRPLYATAHKKRLIRPDLPPEPQDLLIFDSSFLGTEKRSRKARTALREKLAGKIGVEIVEDAA